MQAGEEKLREFIEGKKQYIVPVFQRHYSWHKKQWQQLWSDVIELAISGNKYPHFFGPIVIAEQKEKTSDKLSRFILIDGQQRLITVQILLAAIRDRARELNGDSQIAKEIHEEYLINRHEDSRGDDYYKIKPSRLDRQYFYGIIGGIKKVKNSGNIPKAYHFFRESIREYVSTEEDIKNLANAILGCFKIISIHLGEQDNPYLIFESLNAKGQPLTQADLIRNYLLMEIPEKEAEIIYDRYWSKMEANLRDEMTDFLRLLLIKQGIEVRKNDFYFKIKSQIESRKHQKTVGEYVEEICRFADYYHKFLVPANENNIQLARCLERVKKLGINSVYSILLNCYDYRERKLTSQEEFVQICRLLENFLIRRFVCRIDTRELSDLFPQICKKINRMAEENQLGDGVVLKFLRDELSNRRYPTDAEFRESLQKERIYKPNKKDTIILILASIEEYINPGITLDFDNLKLEHIIPEKLDEWWREYLGCWQEDIANCIGNLTVVEYDIKPTISPFAERKQSIMGSKMQLNKYLEKLEHWREEEIKERAEYLADICLEIWPDLRRK